MSKFDEMMKECKTLPSEQRDDYIRDRMWWWTARGDETQKKSLIRAFKSDHAEALDDAVKYADKNARFINMFAFDGDVPTKETVAIIAKWMSSDAANVPVYNGDCRNLDDDGWVKWPLDKSMLAYGLEYIDRRFSVVTFGNKVRYVEVHKGAVRLFDKQNFTAQYEGRRVLLGKRSCNVAEQWLAHPNRTSYNDVTFCPRCEEDDYTGSFNLFTGFAIKPNADGDCSLLVDHIQTNLCRGNEQHFRYLMAWMAQMFQEPMVKPGVAVVLRGLKGTGKSKLMEWLDKIIGPYHSVFLSQERQLTGQFNAHLEAKLFVGAEEVTWGGNKQAEGVLKDLITGYSTMLERKGIDAVRIDQFFRLMFATNAEWAVPVTEDERRYFVLDVSDARKKDFAYFKAIDEQMKNGGARKFLHTLLTWDYSDVELRDPPVTDGLINQMIQNFTALQHWWMNVLTTGVLLDHGCPRIELTDFETVVEKALVWEEMRPVLKGSYDEKALRTKGGTFLADQYPGLKETQLRKLDGSRPRAFVFPPLEQLRAAFKTKYGVAPWESQDTGNNVYGLSDYLVSVRGRKNGGQNLQN